MRIRIVPSFCTSLLLIAACAIVPLSKRLSGVYNEVSPKTPGAYWTIILEESGKFYAAHEFDKATSNRDGTLNLVDNEYRGTWSAVEHVVTLRRDDGGIEALAIDDSSLQLKLVPHRNDQSELVWEGKWLIR